MHVLLKQKLEDLLKQQWAHFLDRTLLMKFVLENSRNAILTIVKQRELPPPQTKFTITKFDFKSNGFEIWIEFSVPKEDGLCVGSHIAFLNLNTGELELLATSGVCFELETKQCPDV